MTLPESKAGNHVGIPRGAGVLQSFLKYFTPSSAWHFFFLFLSTLRIMNQEGLDHSAKQEEEAVAVSLEGWRLEFSEEELTTSKPVPCLVGTNKAGR